MYFPHHSSAVLVCEQLALNKVYSDRTCNIGGAIKCTRSVVFLSFSRRPQVNFLIDIQLTMEEKVKKCTNLVDVSNMAINWREKRDLMTNLYQAEVRGSFPLQWSTHRNTES